jgi:hypothetical protein
VFGTLGPTLAALEGDVGVLRIKDNERRRKPLNAFNCADRDRQIVFGARGRRLAHSVYTLFTPNAI